MTASEYIQSGAIEACVYGLATEEEWYELEQMCARFAEVAEARAEIEAAMEALHRSAAVAPSPQHRSRVLQALQAERDQATAKTPDTAKGDILAKNSVGQATPPNEPLKPPIPLHTAAPKSIRWLRGMVAASILLLMGSILLNIYFWSQYQSARRDYAELLVQQNTLLARNEALQTSFNIVQNAQMKQVVLEAAPGRQNVKATVYWAGKNGDLYLLINQLPPPKPGKQYQLWAIVGGQPVSAGVVPLQPELLVKMETIESAQAFAITLENEGGSSTPTLDEMMVMGKI